MASLMMKRSIAWLSLSYCMTHLFMIDIMKFLLARCTQKSERTQRKTSKQIRKWLTPLSKKLPNNGDFRTSLLGTSKLYSYNGLFLNNIFLMSPIGIRVDGSWFLNLLQETSTM